MTVDSKESALSRWSRRKLESAREAAEAVPDTLPQAPEETPGGGPAESDVDLEARGEDEKPALTDADMPDIDSLDENSDFSPFMSPGVSDKLRNLALRKLFRAPVFNIRDGLDEYDDDFTKFEKLGDIVTCDMKHRIEMEEKKRREALAAEAAAAEEGGEQVDAEAAGAEDADPTDSAGEAPDGGEERLAALDSGEPTGDDDER